MTKEHLEGLFPLGELCVHETNLTRPLKNSQPVLFKVVGYEFWCMFRANPYYYLRAERINYTYCGNRTIYDLRIEFLNPLDFIPLHRLPNTQYTRIVKAYMKYEEQIK